MAVTGWKSPSNLASIGTGSAWANPANAGASDNTYSTTAAMASSGAATQALRAYGFGFSTADIPAGSRIDGIEVTVERKGSGTNLLDGTVSLMIHAAGSAADRIGGNMAKAGAWTTADVVQTYGGAADYWTAMVFENDVRNPAFGFDFVATTTSKTSVTASVDAVQMRVGARDVFTEIRFLDPIHDGFRIEVGKPLFDFRPISAFRHSIGKTRQAGLNHASAASASSVLIRRIERRRGAPNFQRAPRAVVVPKTKI